MNMSLVELIRSVAMLGLHVTQYNPGRVHLQAPAGVDIRALRRQLAETLPKSIDGIRLRSAVIHIRPMLQSLTVAARRRTIEQSEAEG